MKKALLIVIVLAVCGLGVWMLQGVQHDESGVEKPMVKIGVMLPLSGDMANFGKPAKGALDVAIKHLKERDTKYNYEFVVEDNLFDNVKSNTILSKFLSVDKIDALLDGGAGVGNITSPIMEKRKLLHLNIWSSDANVAKGKYNFINWTQPPYESEKMADIIRSKGYKNVWLIAVNHSGPTAMANNMSEVLNKYNINHQVKKFNFGTRDMRIELQDMKDKGADLFVLFLFDPEMSIFIKQADELGLGIDITSIEVFSFIGNIGLIEGKWYVDAAEGQGSILDEIKNYNKSEVLFGVSNMYDNVMLLVDAFEKADVKEKAVDELLKVKEYNGITGHLVQDEEGVFQSQAIVKQVINGKPVVIE